MYHKCKRPRTNKYDAHLRAEVPKADGWRRSVECPEFKRNPLTFTPTQRLQSAAHKRSNKFNFPLPLRVSFSFSTPRHSVINLLEI
jgi:hypothetical protein